MWLIAGAAVVAGAPPLGVAALMAASSWPLPAASILLVLIARQVFHERQVEVSPEVELLVGLGTELRAGASLRMALSSASSGLPGLDSVRRSAMSGRPMSELASLVEQSLPGHGLMIGAALRLAASVGGSVAPLFEELASQVIDADELRRERRVAMAPAVAQGVILAGIPLVAAARLVASGRLWQMAAGSPVSLVMIAVGIALVLAGSLVILLLIRRAARA